MPIVFSVFSNYAGNRGLAYLFAGPCWLAMHVSDPGLTGDTSTEVAGAGYKRQPITFSSPSGKTIVSTNAPIFTAEPAVDVYFFAVWDAVAAGNLIARQPLGTHLSVPESGQVRMAKGDIAWSL